MFRLLRPELIHLASAAMKGVHRLFSLTAIHLRFLPNGEYMAEASDAQHLVRVTGSQPADAADYPDLPALRPGKPYLDEALIPATSWKDAFRHVQKHRRGLKPVLNHVAVAVHPDDVTMVSSDLDTVSVATPRQVEGRFPDTANLFPRTAPLASVRVKAGLLINLLRIASEMLPDDVVTLEVRKDDAPIIVRGSTPELKFEGLVMPISPPEESK